MKQEEKDIAISMSSIRNQYSTFSLPLDRMATRFDDDKLQIKMAKIYAAIKTPRE